MVRKIVLIWLILLLFLIPEIRAQEYNQISISFANQPVATGIKAIEKAGVSFVNLPFLNKYLYIISKWDPDNGNIDLKFGKLHYIMTENNTKYTVDGLVKQLSVPPFERDEQLWLPVDFLLQLGLAIKKSESNQLRLDWATNYLLGIENVTYQKRPAFLLISSKSLQVKASNLLQKPERLMIDLNNIKIHPAFDNRISGDQNIKAVRVGVRDENSTRLVFDLERLTGYQIIKSPEHEEKIMIVFNGFVEDLKFVQNGPVRKVQITTSLPTEYRMTKLAGSDRILLDLEGVTLHTSLINIPGDGKWIRNIRIAQFNSQTVRVVLDLVDAIPCYAIHLLNKPNLLEIRTVQTINSVQWSNEHNGILTITGDSELVSTVSKTKNPEQLQVELNYFRFAPGLVAPKVKNVMVKGIRLVVLSDTKLRIEVDMGQKIHYQLESVDGQRSVKIHFQPSMLQKKVVVLDAGHGGVDPGTCGGQGTREKDITLDLTMRLKELLEDAGAYVILTRSGDRYISLFERPFVANYYSADLFISLHCNSFPENRHIRGLEVYYYQKSAAKLLAHEVMDQLILGTKLENHGVKSNNYAVLVETQMPSILVELGYLSNYEEETLINTSDFKDDAVKSIFEGIVAYYQK